MKTNLLLIFVVTLLMMLFQPLNAQPSNRNNTKRKNARRSNAKSLNKTPIVGILTQEVSRLIERKYPDHNFTSYIAASYVKFIEGAGGRVIPIWIGKSRDYYEDILRKINGVLLPGGATYFNQSNGYADAGQHIYDIASDMNDRGQFMPIWGTCLGFELLAYLSANRTELRTDCASTGQALPLKFRDDEQTLLYISYRILIIYIEKNFPGYNTSRIFKNAPKRIVNILQKYPVTSNFHIYCFTEETFSATKLDQKWNVMSVSYDWNGLEFISTMEHKRYPFYGVQFHPEKNLYEFMSKGNIPHTANAVMTSQYFAAFVVNEARKSDNHFANSTEEMSKLIYNYAPVYTGSKGSAFLQQYLFSGS